MRRLDRHPLAAPITLELDGETLPARDGEPVACALLAAGETLFSRSVKYHRARGPYCMAGSCSHCLMTVDGVPNLYTCQIPARQGMQLQRQNSFPTAKLDVFATIDWLFPRGLDHHEMFAGVPVAEQVMAKVARHLAGLGLLPKAAAPVRASAEVVRTPLVIVGAGAAGLAAAEEATARGLRFVLLEREASVGGRWTAGAAENLVPPAVPRMEPGTLRQGTKALGLYEDEGGPFLVTLGHAGGSPRLSKVYAETFLLTVGGHPAMLAFENNDLPGIFSGRAASVLLRRHGLVVGERVALVGRGEELDALAPLLTANGSELVAFVDTGGPPGPHAPPGACQGSVLKAHGGSKVTGLTFETQGHPRRVKCDAVVVALPLDPSFELARQGGARVVWHADHASFVVEAGHSGSTRAKRVFVAGELCGPMSAGEAAASGKRAVAGIVEART